MIMNVILLSRKISVIILVLCGLLVLISGMILEVAPHGPGSRDAIALGLTKSQWIDIHRYTGFIAAGTAVVHVYTNYRSLLYHLGLLRPRRGTAVHRG